jgi:hypothetical protein
MSDFKFVESSETEKKPVKITGVKRKSVETENKAELLNEAKSYCKTSQEFSSLSKMTPKALRVFIDQKSFEKTANLRNSVVEGIHSAYAFLIDKLSKGDGYISDRILQDDNLKDSIQDEIIPIFSYINNKLKIGILSGTHIYNGKMEQRKHQPMIEEIHEENQEKFSFQPTEKNDHGQQFSFDDNNNERVDSFPENEECLVGAGTITETEETPSENGGEI